MENFTCSEKKSAESPTEFELSILPYVTEEIQEIIQGKYMLNIDSYTAAPVSLFSIVNKAHCQKKD